MRNQIIKLFCESELDETKMFHGSHKGYTSPRPGMIYWVTTSRELAQDYAKEGAKYRGGEPIVYAYEVNVKHPAKVANDYMKILHLLNDWVIDRPNKNVDIQKITALKNEIIKHWYKVGLDNSETSTYNHWNMSGEEGNTLLMQFLKELGYDSIHYVERGADTYGLFDAEKLKQDNLDI